MSFFRARPFCPAFRAALAAEALPRANNQYGPSLHAIILISLSVVHTPFHLLSPLFPPPPPTELEIVGALNEAVTAHQADVLFGSYPFYGEAAGPRVIITLESQDEARAEAAKDFFLARVRPEWVLRVADDDVLDRETDAAGARPE